MRRRAGPRSARTEVPLGIDVISVTAFATLLSTSFGGARPAVRAVAELAPSPELCAAGPAYYAITLATTRNVPGTGLARGTAEVALPRESPFSIGVASDGSYMYRLSVSLEGTGRLGPGVLVAWVTRPDLSEVRRLGALGDGMFAEGMVDWNQFLVVISLEPSDDALAPRWSGPVAFRGMSRSGGMHTMVGHGALEQENCAAWGYGG